MIKRSRLWLYRILLTTCLMAPVFFATAQNIVLVTQSGKLLDLDISTGTCVTRDITPPCAGSIFSIALYKDTLYFINNSGELVQSLLNRPNSCKVLTTGVGSNALTVDKKGVLYWMQGGSDLTSFDPHTNVKTRIGYTYFNSSGDLMFYNDKLYLASNAGLVEINMSDPRQSTIYIPLNDIGYALYGLVSVPVSCNANKTYGITGDIMGGTSFLVEIDMENRKAIKNTYCPLPDVIYDAASITETGGIQGIGVTAVNLQSQCGLKNNGSIQVTAFSASQTSISYSLNGVSNTDGLFDKLPSGQFTIHMQDTKGCTADTTVAIVLRDAVEIGLNVTADTCAAQNGTATVNQVKGSSPFQYTVNNQYAGTSPSFTKLAAGNYVLTIRDANNCRLDTFFTVLPVRPNSPVKTITALAESCTATGGELRLEYLPGVTNLLGARLNGGTLQTAAVFAGLTAGSYQLQVVTSSCVYDSVVHIPVKPPVIPEIIFSNTAPTCKGGSDASFRIAVKDMLSPFAVSVNGSNFTNNTQYKDLQAGVYQVSIKDASGCLWNQQNTIDPSAVVLPQVQPTITHAECWQSQPGKIRLLISGPNTPYRFEVNGNRYMSGQEATGLQPGTYKAIIRNAGHCAVDTLDFVVSRLNSNGTNCDTVYVPTAFTPNGDGRNDVLRPAVNSGIRSFTFRVYNRYGEPVFESRAVTAGWDGRFKGQEQPAGAYVWILEGLDGQGQKRLFKGSLVLIR